MEIVPFSELSDAQREDAARVLFVAMERFTTGWNTIEEAREEVSLFLDEPDNLGLAGFLDEALIGWIGAIQHTEYGWELHPVAIDPKYQKQGHGRSLVEVLESHARDEGVLTLWLGTDDDYGGTTLFGMDLFPNPLEKLNGLAPINNEAAHPFTFYQHLGYTTVGILPNVDGPGMHDILMAKQLTE